MLVIRSIMGTRKTIVLVVLMIVMAALTGTIYGALPGQRRFNLTWVTVDRIEKESRPGALAMEIKPIGVIHSPFTDAAGTPIQTKLARETEGAVTVFSEYAEALQDLDGFERIWLLYWFHRAAPARLIVRPYLDETPRGLFATRAPSRPNPIGISTVRLLRVDGCDLHVAGLDILDGSPLLDIKPYAPKFDHFEVDRAGWLDHVAETPGAADERFSLGNNEQEPGG